MEPKTKRVLGSVLGLIFVILGIIGIAISVGIYGKVKDIETQGRFGVIIDAGGSGTRLVVYEYKNHKDLIQVAYTKCEDKGIAKYINNIDVLKNTLKKCLDKAKDSIPKRRIGSVPLYMEATAGMRLLKLVNETSYNNIWNAARSVLEKSPFKFKNADTLSGKEEAVYGWTALNHLKGDFSKYGGVEMGSSSTQVSFIPSAKLPSNSTDTMKIAIDGKSYTTYVHSYLCYGRSEIERRYKAKLVKDAGFTNTVMDPCLSKGYEKNVTAEFLWAQPCSSGKYALSRFGEELIGPASTKMYLLKGESNTTKCFSRVKALLNKARCTHGMCTFDNVFQPMLHGDFVAYGAIYYPLSILNLTSRFTRSEYKSAITRLCDMSWSELKSIPGEKLKYKPGRCLDTAYYYTYLTHGLHFTDSNWKLEFIKKVNGASISWALGFQFAKKDQMSLPIIAHHRGLLFGPFIGIILLSVFLILGGIVIIVLFNKTQRGKMYTQPAKMAPVEA